MPHLARRPWVPTACEDHVQRLATAVSAPSDVVTDRIEALIARNSAIHDAECFNLNPATNVMNPRAEAALARGARLASLAGLSGRQIRNGVGSD